jgi:hypothetical protein
VNARQTYWINYWQFVNIYYDAKSENDIINWCFDTDPEVKIVVVACNQKQYDEWFNHLVSDYTSELCWEETYGCGKWNVPSKGRWYILYTNVDNSYNGTNIGIDESIEYRKSNLEIILPYIIGGLIGLSILIGISIVYFKMKKKKKEQIMLLKPPSYLLLKREYEFVGGQVKFKLSLENLLNFPLTNIRITFEIPKALKWILYEPDYKQMGESILISKVGAKEKTSISLYLEPINCMNSSINATVSFYDVNDKPQAITMKPKLVSITCPMFFTEEDANLARVKSIQRSFTHQDKKIFPVVSPEKSVVIFSSILSEVGKFDIKLVSKEFSEEDMFGEAWYFGITKVKKNRIVTHIILDGKNKVLDIEVSGNEEDQITAFLAEIGDRIRRQLINKKVIPSQEGFNDMRIFILSNICPICYEAISEESVQKFLEGEGIKCENCYARIPKIPIYVRKVKKLKWLYQNNKKEN